MQEVNIIQMTPKSRIKINKQKCMGERHQLRVKKTIDRHLAKEQAFSEDCDLEVSKPSMVGLQGAGFTIQALGR